MMSWLVRMAQRSGYRKFVESLDSPEVVQRAKLKMIFRNLRCSQFAKQSGIFENTTYEEFRELVPVTTYDFWQKNILQQMTSGENIVCGETQRFQPTSGTTSAQKYIPYTQSFMSEMDAGIQAWLGDLANQSKDIFAGSQYWSLSWLPEAQRKSHPGNNDIELLPFWQAFLFEKVMAVPGHVNRTKTMEESQFATLVYLCSRSDLSLVSVWSPTFWLVLMKNLELWREQVAATLESGKWQWSNWSSPEMTPPPKNSKVSEILMRNQGLELYKKLWPKLKLISCWDSAGSQTWAAQVRELHPNVFVQGKGLWATEGVFTIPFQQKYPVAITSHFYEWMDLENEQIVPTWKLQLGQTVQPLISSSNGLLRYKMCDSLRVNGFIRNTPTLEFLGRFRETDLVGEKLSSELVLQTFDFVSQTVGVRPVSMLAVRAKARKPYYLALLPENSANKLELEKNIEGSLSRIFNYKLAREIGQLDSVRVQIEKQPEQYYYEIFQRKGMLRGDIKLETLAEISEEHLL